MHVEVPHACGRTHRGHQSLAECAWPDAAYVVGDGPFALLARCDLFTVSLYETGDEARRRKQVLDQRGCATRCEGSHEVVALIDELELSPLRARVARSGRRQRTSSRGR
jgi:hypothetical protein